MISPENPLQRQRGVSLIELVVALSVLAILMTMAVPSFVQFRERQALRGAAEGLVNQVASYRFESVRRNRDISIAFSGTAGSTAWCVGAREGVTPCDCATDATECDIGVFPADGAVANAGVVLVSRGGFGGDNAVTFDPATGTPTTLGDAGNVVLRSPTTSYGYQLRMDINGLGRASLCVPTGSTAIIGLGSC